MVKKIDVDAVARAIEADAGEALPDLRQALAEAKAGAGRVTTPAQLPGQPNAETMTSFAEGELVAVTTAERHSSGERRQ